MRNRAIYGSYAFFLLLVVIFSYSQIDLNLTLSSWYPYQNFQKLLIQLGYFNRPLAAQIYLVQVVGLFLFWLYFLKLAFLKKLSSQKVFSLVILTSGILLFAYPAFSHDVFNYMFDAKILVHYAQNPYTHRALDFPSDEWLRFMHWVHRYTPYGPVWLGISTVPFTLGFGKFVLTLFNFKLLATGAHVISVWLMSKILVQLKVRNVACAMVLFGLHPLVLTESLISAHNDGVMIALGLLSFWLLVKGQWVKGWMGLLLSIGVKYVTIVVVPIWFLTTVKRISYPQNIFFSTLALGLAIGIVVAQIFNKGATGAEFYPWFLIWPLSFAALLPDKRWIQMLFSGVALGLLLRYVPYLLVGSYPTEVQGAKSQLTLIGTIFGIAGMLFLILRKK